ncbi:MAG: cytochrome c oxidase subunit I [Thermomicrobia bacterium]|nr:cytochrome c oxidase subunit I [Thermomicrobia bacterium]MCA1723481.1 cytochrome c oxidase subunit I [Thermomicrobia bacterium]
MANVALVPELDQPLPKVESDEGLLSWVASVDHKQIGIMYLIATLFFFVVGGFEAELMRIQLAKPENSFLSPAAYNQIFTMHGTTMVFLVVMPMLIGFGNYLVPLMIGARDMAFPRMNALSFWLLIFGGLLLYYSFIGGGAPDAGWFSYAPLSERAFSFTSGLDYWALGLLTTGIGTVLAGINLIVTILARRAPGLSIKRLPLFVWMTLVNSVLIIFALPILNASLVMLLADRQLDAHFFTPASGGSAILWQHYFWGFGHPEVYIMVLPAFGIISEVIPVFSRKPIYGYGFVAGSTLGIAFLSFAVWAHHMFAVGLGRGADIIFSGASMLIAVPTGIKIFNWVATMWGGAIRFTTSMCFAIAFLVLFTIGGISGVSFAVVPTDWQTTDTYFVVAHMHYVLFGGTLFAIFAGIYYWFPKATGKMLSEKLGKWVFGLMFIGFNLTFGVQHILGILGMPRRVFTYPNLPWWGALNLASTIGALTIALSVIVFFCDVITSLHHGAVAGDNPWQAWTLEWATTSPPPIHNFDRLPPIRSRRPLWDVAHPENPDWKRGKSQQGAADTEEIGINTNIQGTALFLASEAVFFVLLILAFIYYHKNFFNESSGSPPNAGRVLDPVKTGIYTVCLLASSLTIWWAGHSLKRGNQRMMRLSLFATVILGAIFLYGQGREYQHLISQNVTISRNLFGSTFFTLTGFHGLHVFMGLVAITILFGLALAGAFKKPHSVAIEAISLYWHFVDVVWIVIFATVYLWARV